MYLNVIAVKRSVLDLGLASILPLLDLSAAFDTVNHNTLLSRMENM